MVSFWFIDHSAYRVLVDARDWRSGFISRADVADFLVKQVNDASLVHKTPALDRGQVRELLDILTGLASFEDRALRLTIVSYS